MYFGDRGAQVHMKFANYACRSRPVVIAFVRYLLTQVEILAEIMARTITIDPGDELRQFIEQQVSSGSYKTSSEVVREGLRLLQEKQAASKLALLKKLLAEGEASGDAQAWDIRSFLNGMDTEDERKED